MMKRSCWIIGTILIDTALASENDHFVQPRTNYINGECVENYDPEVHGDIDFFPVHSSTERLAKGSEFRGKVQADYSLLWGVTYHGNYKLLENKLRGETFVLWQCGTPKPEVEGAAAYFEVPVKKISITSTTYMPYVEMIGEREALVAYTSPFSYVSSPCLRQLFLDDKIREAIDENGAIELSADEVDLTIADEWTVESVPKGYSITDTHEETVLQVAEYVEVVGLFFNREHEASLALDRILEAYTCLRNDIQSRVLTSSGQERKKVVLASYVSSANAFSIASCPNWYCEVIEDAGGELLAFEGEGEVEMWGSKFMSLDQFVALTADADIYISAGPLNDEVSASLMANLSVPIFDNQGPLGYNDWWERRLAEPDAVLADIAVMLWPDVFDSSRNFFRDIRAGEAPGSKVPTEALDAVCPNPNAPYVFLISAASDCLETALLEANESHSSTKKTNKNVALVAGLAAALALIVLAAFAVLFVSHRRRNRLDVEEKKACVELASQIEEEKEGALTKNPTFA